MDNAPPTTWEPDRSVSDSPYIIPPLRTALWRGLRNRCPICGEGKVFSGYLRVVDQCAVCAAPLGSLRADDAPPYFTIFIVGHLFIPPVLWIERHYMPPIWIQMLVWIPLFTVATTLLLRPVKGATVGLMCRLGFGGDKSPG
ncbi:MAG: hypothetical protein JWR10_1126 [Rubritepida sp.]|nr:hypothetical protein [Rubritepida sp.]